MGLDFLRPPLGSEALVSILIQKRGYQFLTSGRDLGFWRELQGRLEDVSEGIFTSHALKGGYPVEKFVQKDTKGPPIDGGRVTVGLDDLRR